MQVIPCSHNLGRIEHKSVNNQVTADGERIYHLLNRMGFVYVKMEKGDGLYFHSNVSWICNRVVDCKATLFGDNLVASKIWEIFRKLEKS